MKKLFLALAALMLMVGCTSTPTTPEPSPTENATDEPVMVSTELKILSPTGAPALALLDLLQTSQAVISTVDGSDVLQAAFVNPNPEYDVIVAPTNLGAKLAAMEKTEYRLAGIVTWGNLFLVGKDAADLQDETKILAAFGEGAVPGLVFNAVLESLDIQAEVVYYNSVSEAQAALLAGNADAALIAEPAATATIAKAKQEGLELQVIGDIQQAWQQSTGFKGYPQAAVFVLKSVYEERPQEVEALLDIIKATLDFGNDAANEADLLQKLETVGNEVLGTPAAQVVVKAYAGMNLEYRPAEEVKDELKAFLELFGVSEIDGIFLK